MRTFLEVKHNEELNWYVADEHGNAVVWECDSEAEATLAMEEVQAEWEQQANEDGV